MFGLVACLRNKGASPLFSHSSLPAEFPADFIWALSYESRSHMAFCQVGEYFFYSWGATSAKQVGEGERSFFFSMNIHYCNSLLSLSSAYFVLFTAIRTFIFLKAVSQHLAIAMKK